MYPSYMVLQVLLSIECRPAPLALERLWIDMDSIEMTEQLSLAPEGTGVPTVPPFATELSVSSGYLHSY